MTVTDRRRLGALVLVLAALIGFAGPVAAAPAVDYIVVLRDSDARRTPAARSHDHARLAGLVGAHVRHSFRHALNGFSTRLTPSQRARLAAHPMVSVVQPDPMERVLDAPAAAAGASGSADATVAAGGSGQFVDDSLRRIGADVYSPQHQDGVDEAVDVDIAIIDSGIEPLADLNVAGGYSCTSSKRDAWRDVYGHGTEVAAIAAARDNDQGIVGVAPGARLWAVKMITNRGYTSNSLAICAVDWVAGQRDPDDPARPLIEVANMSFTIRSGSGTPVDDGACGRTSGDLFHRAVCRMTNTGTIAVAAAGNHGRKVGRNRPAAFSEVIAVSALADFDGVPGGLTPFDRQCLPEETDEDDTFANFSNYGRAIDLIAPGVCMTMPWVPNGGELHQQSGTSFASPLVAGSAALFLAANTSASERDVRSALLAASTGDWFSRTDPDDQPDRLLNLATLGTTDTIAPEASFRRIDFPSDRHAPLLKAPLRIGLTGTDDQPSNVRFELEQRIEDGAWMAVPLGGAATTIAKVPFDSVVTFRVRATDGSGNRSSWVESVPLVGRLVDSASKAIAYAGSWRNVARSDTFGGSIARSSDPGSSATLTVTGRAVAVVVTRGPSRGKGILRLDGEPASTFETLAAELATRRIVTSAAWDSDAPLTISVSPQGTPDRPRIDFDALLVLQQAP